MVDGGGITVWAGALDSKLNRRIDLIFVGSRVNFRVLPVKRHRGTR
jgi:hypothetical protein